MNSRFDEIADLLAKNYSELVSKINKNEERTLVNQERITNNQAQVTELQNQVSELQKQMDEQTDRSLRCTLIFKNIPHEEDENSSESTAVLTKAITNHCTDLSKSYVQDAIERCHRGTSNKPNSPAHIFVKFIDWKKSQLISRAIIEKNKSNKANALNFSQMYSKGTTARRNKALEHRAELLQLNNDSHIIISYPAKVLEKRRTRKPLRL